MSRISLFVLVCTFIGCSSATTPGGVKGPVAQNTVSGTIKGAALSPVSAYFTSSSQDSNQAASNGNQLSSDANGWVQIVVSSTDSACATAQAGGQQSGAGLQLDLPALASLHAGQVLRVVGPAAEPNQSPVKNGNQTTTGSDVNQRVSAATDFVFLGADANATVGQDGNQTVAAAAKAQFQENAASCTTGAYGLSGVVTLGDISAQGLSGAFDLTAGTGDIISGHFVALPCQGAAQAAQCE